MAAKITDNAPESLNARMEFANKETQAETRWRDRLLELAEHRAQFAFTAVGQFSAFATSVGLLCSTGLRKQDVHCFYDFGVLFQGLVLRSSNDVPVCSV